MKQFPSMCCILTALLLCSLSADAVTFTREDYTPDLAFEKRGKTAPQVMMYPEVQYKYALFQNFLGTYTTVRCFSTAHSAIRQENSHTTLRDPISVTSQS